MAVSASFADVIAQGYATSGPAIELGRGVHDGELVPRGGRPGAAGDVNRHGLIAGATGTGKTRRCRSWPSSSRPPACRCSSPTSRATSPAWPRPARPTARPPKRDGRAGLTFDAGGLPGRVPRARRHRRRACRCGRRSPTSGRSCWPRCSAPTRRRSSRLALVFRYADERKACRCSTSPTCARCWSSWTRTRARPTSRASAACRRRRSACCCARSSGSRTAAATSSSASRSSTSPT